MGVFGKLASRFKRTPSSQTMRPLQTDIERQHILSLRARAIPTWSQLKYIPAYLSSGERFLIRISVWLLVASCMVIGIRFWDNNIVHIPKSGGTYTEAMVGFPRYVNPVLAASNSTDADLARIFFPGLLTINENNTLTPDLAESYLVSEDAKTYSFTLKENLRWDDGEPLTIDDVIFTFRLIQDPAYTSPWYFTFKNLTFERTDDRTMTVTLKDASTLFIGYFTIGILPAHRFSDVPPSQFLLVEENTRPTGAGAFKFKSFVRSRSGEIRSMIMERNPLYHGNIAYLNELRFKFYPDTELALEGLKSREVQGLAFVPPWFPKAKSAAVNAKKSQLVLPQVAALFFNMKNDVFKNKDLRRALVLGTDRIGITEKITSGDGLISEGPFAQGFSGFVPDLAPRPLIPAEAEQLLTDVGYVKGENGLRKKGDASLRIVITTLNQSPYPEIANLITENWNALGVETEVQLIDPDRFIQDVLKPRRYDVLLYGELFDQTVDPYTFWHSSQSLDPGLNFSLFVNKQVDTLLQSSRTEWSREKRDANYQEVQRIIADEIPAIFLYTPVYSYLVPKSLHNVPEGNMLTPAYRFTNVSSWFKKTKPVLASSLADTSE